jgi:GxxExxY protein
MKLTEREKRFIQRKVIEEILACAKAVFQDLGKGWSEAIYQKAMEVELRERGIKYEEQRVLPVYYKDKYLVGRGEVDLIVLVDLWSGKRVYIVIDLKVDTDIREDHKIQIQKYIKALKKSLLSENDIVYPVGLIINFAKPSRIRLDKKVKRDKVNNLEIQWLEVEVEDEDVNFWEDVNFLGL